MQSINTRKAPTVGQERYRNGKLYARVEDVRVIEDGTMYYTIRRFVQTRQEWAKSTSTYRWRP